MSVKFKFDCFVRMCFHALDHNNVMIMVMFMIMIMIVMSLVGTKPKRPPKNAKPRWSLTRVQATGGLNFESYKTVLMKVECTKHLSSQNSVCTY